mmetsp:Transcript_12401/g.52154  ORF Transcript_12401/g.52154 Transcript_12401/m.52154 type:complete len:323 (-) Transcript_12401:382-1350(-)
MHSWRALGGLPSTPFDSPSLSQLSLLCRTSHLSTARCKHIRQMRCLAIETSRSQARIHTSRSRGCTRPWPAAAPNARSPHSRPAVHGVRVHVHACDIAAGVDMARANRPWDDHVEHVGPNLHRRQAGNVLRSVRVPPGCQRQSLTLGLCHRGLSVGALASVAGNVQQGPALALVPLAPAVRDANGRDVVRVLLLVPHRKPAPVYGGGSRHGDGRYGHQKTEVDVGHECRHCVNDECEESAQGGLHRAQRAPRGRIYETLLDLDAAQLEVVQAHARGHDERHEESRRRLVGIRLSSCESPDGVECARRTCDARRQRARGQAGA